MALVQWAGFCARFAILLIAAAGCSVPKPSVRQSPPVQAPKLAPLPQSPQAQPSESVQQGGDPAHGLVQQVALRVPAGPQWATAQVDGLFAGQPELSLDQLVAEIEARNPSLQSLAHAWRAAAQRYPQVIRLDDPTFMAVMAPASFNSSQVNPGYTLQGAQKLPWFGTLRTRGEGAQAETGAAFQDLQDARLVIRLIARLAYYDYYLAERQLEINEENLQAAHDFRDTAKIRYEDKLVGQQDVIQADVDLADLHRRKIELERVRLVAIARINTLLLRPADGRLPPSPKSLPPQVDVPAADLLRQMALARRPDLAAISARVRADQAAVELARLQYYPDTEFFGRYDPFWQETDLQAAAGLNMNVPIYRRRLNAAVSEAQFRLAQRRAEYRQRALEIEYEVQSAYEQVEEARRTTGLFSTQYVPLAEQNLAVARADYDVGKTNFLIVIMAQRQTFDVRERYEQVLADYYRRLADLERAVGGPLPPPAEEIPRPMPN